MVSRRLKNRKSLMQTIRLFLIDEIHVLGETSRGAVIEAVVSRMKTLALNKSASADASSVTMNSDDEDTLRFVAVSATIPNIDDVF